LGAWWLVPVECCSHRTLGVGERDIVPISDAVCTDKPVAKPVAMTIPIVLNRSDQSRCYCLQQRLPYQQEIVKDGNLGIIAAPFDTIPNECEHS